MKRYDTKRSGLSIKDKASYFLSTARGVPIRYDLRAYGRVVGEIRRLDLSRVGDAELARRAAEIRQRVREGGSPDNELVASFALIAEMCVRALGLRPFDGQLFAGLAMNEGKLAQMQTGEGKTLAAVFAVCLNALDGGGVHVLTANDYLARRDAEWMRPVYEYFGLSVASIADETELADRERAYAADVTYLTAKQAGFDYLKDGLRYDPALIAQRNFNMALVDEADFLLIDEARVPLVIAASGEADSVDPYRVNRVVLGLRRGADFRVDQRGRTIRMMPECQRRIQEGLGIGGIHEEEFEPYYARAYAALYAQNLLRRDVDYIVRDGQIELVDEFTGRVADKRRWPYGVQAALEAKEGLTLKPEGRLYGSIAVQHFINLYPKLAAMTATAVPSAEELFRFYGLETVVIPPGRPVLRIDGPDAVFRTRTEKTRAVLEEIDGSASSGRPVLVGTASVRESEELAQSLVARGVACSVLNAKNDAEEAAIIARAGTMGAVTISTNMAGRGTDIKLGGPESDPKEYDKLIRAGGLYVLGTNRHESRRVDDQLRGRAGRQGEPGRARFFVSLEDPLFVKYGVPEFLPRAFREKPADPLSTPALPDLSGESAALEEIDRAQRLIAGENSRIRYSLRKYSLILENQRLVVRETRDQALRARELPEEIEADEAVAAKIRVSDRGKGTVIGARAEDDSGDDPRDLLVTIFLYYLDTFWADHLALVDDIREGIHLVRYGGRDPGTEYIRTVFEAFEKGFAAAGAAAARAFAEADGSSLARLGIKLPTATWTYLIDEEPLPQFNLSMLSSSNMGFAALAAGPAMMVSAAAALLRRMVEWYRKVWGNTKDS